MNSKSSYQPAKTHRKFMRQAIQLGEQAYEEDEIPVGALVVYKKQIIGKGYNQVERLKDPSAHAEMLALSAACSSLSSKYLTGCTIYVTLEPCPMCATALVWSKIDQVVFGTADAEYGACGSIFNLTANSALNHQVHILQGIMEDECEQMLKAFFREKRENEQ